MKKLTVLSFYKDWEETTRQLQELGVLHPENGELSVNKDVETLEIKKNQCRKVIDYLKANTQLEKSSTENKSVSKQAIEEVLENVENIRLERDDLRKRKEVLVKEFQKVMPWGDFDKEKVTRIEEKGIKIRFHVAKKKNYRRFDFSGIDQYVIHKNSERRYFVVVTEKDQKLRLPFEEVSLPQLMPSEIKKQLDQISLAEEEIKKELQKYCKYIPALENEFLYLQDLVNYFHVSNSFEQTKNGKILTISGWYPEKAENNLVKTLQDQNIAFFTASPTVSDRVPIQLRNNWYTRLFEPITRIFQLPNYNEFDLTPLVAVFYPIFFAYCLGDAGYGFVLVVLSIAGGFTILKNNKNIAIFGVLLGLFTTLMGVVKSGNIFGIPLSSSSDIGFFRFLSQFLVIPDDNSFVFNAFNVALMIGVVQILVGIASAALKSYFFHSLKHSLYMVGKLLIISSVIILFLANMQNVTVLQPYTQVAYILLISGIGMVLFFHDLKASILKRLGTGLLPLFFIFTGILGDVLSYVRLFALGVVSSVLGLVVNQIGIQIIGNGWWGVILGVVFLIFGHSLNFALAVLGSFVHPLRLTFVEFYNNAQFEGGGLPYSPFKKVKT